MSADHYEIEYHLTPGGWITGTSYYYGKADEVVDPPVDRVLTIKKEVTQSSGYSPEDVSWDELWRDPDIQNVDALVVKYGNRPSKHR